MPEFYLYLLVVVVALFAADKFVVPLVRGPLHVIRNLRLDSAAPLNPVLPTDPRMPEKAKWLIADTWAQLRPLGFEPSIYLRQDGVAGTSVTYCAIFVNHANQDGAAVSVSFIAKSTGLVGGDGCVEFSAETPERLDVCTSNASTPEFFREMDGEDVVRLPEMRDLAALYQAHHKHLDECGIKSKRRPPSPLEYPEDMKDATMRRCEKLCALGRLHRAETEKTYRYGWKVAVRIVWGLRPVLGRVRQALVRRRARRWLRRHDLPSRYQTIDYKLAMTDHRDFDGELPTPDWYPSFGEADGKQFFHCAGCQHVIASESRGDGSAVCPACNLQQDLDEARAVEFDLGSPSE